MADATMQSQGIDGAAQQSETRQHVPQTSAGQGAPRSKRGTVPLNDDCRATLRVLGYLFLRMGRIESARRTFATLAATLPEEVSARERSWVERNLAAIALEENDSNAALNHLNNAMRGITMNTSDAALYLMKARALWRQGRHEEARQALNTYMHLAGAKA